MLIGLEKVKREINRKRLLLQLLNKTIKLLFDYQIVT